MDAHEFDRWVATLTRRRTRRAGLRLLAGGLLGGLLSRGGAAPSAAQIEVAGPPPDGLILTCADAGLTDCGGVCVDTLTDPDNCGGCGGVCGPGWSCLNAVCLVEAPPIGVSLVDCAGQGVTDCGGFCTDLSTDSANCGACGASCPLGGYCQSGACAGLVCPSGLTDCGVGYCVDLGSDPNYCGGCEFGCFAGYDCVNGACV